MVHTKHWSKKIFEMQMHSTTLSYNKHTEATPLLYNLVIYVPVCSIKREI